MPMFSFLLATGLCAAILATGLVYGIAHWREPYGKYLSLGTGALLAGLVIFVAAVSFLSLSAQWGAPL